MGVLKSQRAKGGDFVRVREETEMLLRQLRKYHGTSVWWFRILESVWKSEKELAECNNLESLLTFRRTLPAADQLERGYV